MQVQQWQGHLASVYAVQGAERLLTKQGSKNLPSQPAPTWPSGCTCLAAPAGDESTFQGGAAMNQCRCKPCWRNGRKVGRHGGVAWQAAGAGSAKPAAAVMQHNLADLVVLLQSVLLAQHLLHSHESAGAKKARWVGTQRTFAAERAACKQTHSGISPPGTCAWLRGSHCAPPARQNETVDCSGACMSSDAPAQIASTHTAGCHQQAAAVILASFQTICCSSSTTRLQLLAALLLRAHDLALRLLRRVLSVQGLLPVVCTHEWRPGSVGDG